MLGTRKNVIYAVAQDNPTGAYLQPPRLRAVRSDNNGNFFVRLAISGEGVLQSVNNDVDNVVPSSDPDLPREIPVNNYNYLFDGTNFDRARSMSQGNMTAAAHPLGVTLVGSPRQLSAVHAPAVATRATAGFGAIVGSKYVCVGLSYSLCAVGAVAVPVQVNLRDGATGAGAILWNDRFIAPAGTTITRNVENLSLCGTTGNAMTFEFAAAPAGTDFQTVTVQMFRIDV